MITKRKFCCYKNGTTYSYYLHTEKILPSVYNKYLACRIGNQTLYCPFRVSLFSIAVSGFNFRRNNDYYGLVNQTPRLEVTFDKQTTSIFIRLNNIKVAMATSIGNNITLQVSVNNNWTDVGTLTSGSVSASFSNITAPSSYKLRLKIGDWVSSEFTDSGTIIDIPEAQWGV